MSDRRLTRKTRPVDRAPLDIGVLAGHLGYFIRRLQVWVFQDFIRTLAAIDIRPAQYSVLVVIAANRGTSQSQLSSRLGIERARLVRLLNRLEKRGLVERLEFDEGPPDPCAAAHAQRPQDAQARQGAGGAA